MPVYKTKFHKTLVYDTKKIQSLIMNETIEGTEKLINFGQDMQQIIKKVQTYNKKNEIDSFG